MQEIKYQIWHKPTKTIQVVAQIDFNNKVVDTYGIDEPIYGIPFADLEWRIYTGRKSKNGSEIYTRDIINYVSPTYRDEKIGIILFDSEYCGLIMEGRDGNSLMLTENITHNSVVLGNIDQNPELLNETPNN